MHTQNMSIYTIIWPIPVYDPTEIPVCVYFPTEIILISWVQNFQLKMAVLTNRRHKRSEDKRGVRSGTGMSWPPPYWVIMVAGSLHQYPEPVQVALSCFCWLLPDFVPSSLNSAIANPGAPLSFMCFPKSYLQLCK